MTTPRTYRGYEIYHTSDRSGLNLSKASLGRFMYHLLKMEGFVINSWAHSPGYDRSAVSLVVDIKPEIKDKLEEATGIKLTKPPTIVCN